MKTIALWGLLILCSCSAPNAATGGATEIDAAVADAGTGGIRIHYGPRDMSDPAEVAKYTLDVGAESVLCMVVPNPSPIDVMVSGYSVRERPGMHHLSVLTSNATPTTDPGPCVNVQQFLFLAQRATEDVSFGTAEHPALAVKVPASVRYQFQAHAINTTNQPILVDAVVTLHEPTGSTEQMSGLVMNGGMKMNIPPHTAKTITDTIAAPRDLSILALVGHFHSHTSEERISAAGKVVYTDRTWEEPPWQWHTIPMKSGDVLSWSCDINNTLDTPIIYNDHVLTAEMCTLSGFVLGAKPWAANLP